MTFEEWWGNGFYGADATEAEAKERARRAWVVSREVCALAALAAEEEFVDDSEELKAQRCECARAIRALGE